MIVHNFDPVFIDFGVFQIRWYSIAYILGIILGWIYCKKKLIKNTKILNLFDDLVTYRPLERFIGSFSYIFWPKPVKTGLKR